LSTVSVDPAMTTSSVSPAAIVLRAVATWVTEPVTTARPSRPDRCFSARERHTRPHTRPRPSADHGGALPEMRRDGKMAADRRGQGPVGLW
jgi:hypothetical protein